MEVLVESIERIKVGDTRDEVERLLGKADRVTHKEWVYHLDEHSGYLFSFDNEDRVEAVDLWMD
jgi:hypothetical protein